MHVELSTAQARSAFDSLLRDVEDFLDLHLVHGDLSTYNVLWHDDRPRIIDVPQAIDLHGRPDGFAYFDRDVSNLERYFARYGLSGTRLRAAHLGAVPARAARPLRGVDTRARPGEGPSVRTAARPACSSQ